MFITICQSGITSRFLNVVNLSLHVATRRGTRSQGINCAKWREPQTGPKMTLNHPQAETSLNRYLWRLSRWHESVNQSVVDQYFIWKTDSSESGWGTIIWACRKSGGCGGALKKTWLTNRTIAKRTEGLTLFKFSAVCRHPCKWIVLCHGAKKLARTCHMEVFINRKRDS